MKRSNKLLTLMLIGTFALSACGNDANKTEPENTETTETTDTAETKDDTATDEQTSEEADTEKRAPDRQKRLCVPGRRTRS